MHIINNRDTDPNETTGLRLKIRQVLALRGPGPIICDFDIRDMVECGIRQGYGWLINIRCTDTGVRHGGLVL